MKKPGSAKWCWALLVGCSLYGLALPSAYGVEKKEVVRQARQAYYNLRSEGMAEFQCSLEPNWAPVLAEQQKTNPEAAARALQILKQLQFAMSLSPTGAVRVTHKPMPTQDKQLADAFEQIFSGMEQMITGFFQTWSPFLLSSPFPEVESEYDLEDQGQQYRLSYKEDTANVVTTMSKDFAIRELRVTAPGSDTVMHPHFTRIPKGFLLTGYHADYEGASPAESTHLDVQIDYQGVNGLELPQRLGVVGSYGGSPIQIEVAFTGCQATKR